jgi:hypothetical protein
MRSVFRQEAKVTYRIAGIDVHKRMLAVVIADVAVEGEYQFERRKVSTSPSALCRLADWLVAQPVEEVVGIDRAILATGVGDSGTALET